MRQGINCALVELASGSLAEVRRCLESWRFVCRPLAPGALRDEPSPAEHELLVVEIGAGWTDEAAALVAGYRAGRCCLALCPEHDARTVSVAASLGVDDILPTPLDPVELVRRLQSLSTLAELGAEYRLRRELFAPYRPPPRTASIPPADPAGLPEIIMIGDPDAYQAAVVAALPSGRVIYLDRASRLPPVLRGGGIGLVVITSPREIAACLEQTETVPVEPPVLLAAHEGAPTALELPPQIDLLPLPAPPAVARARLQLALRGGELRRSLRRPPPGDAAALLLDGLTGLYNQGAFLDYLRGTGDARAVIGLELDRLEQLNVTAGYAAGNRALAQLGQNLAARLRAEDLAGHLGGGRFAVAGAANGRLPLGRMRQRLQETVAEGESWDVLPIAEALPVRGAPAHRLARLFGDLRRLRPAA